MNLKNSGVSTGFEPMTSAIPVQCSNQLSYEVTQWRAGQFSAVRFIRGKYVNSIKKKRNFHVLKLNFRSLCDPFETNRFIPASARHFN